MGGPTTTITMVYNYTIRPRWCSADTWCIPQWNQLTPNITSAYNVFFVTWNVSLSKILSFFVNSVWNGFSESFPTHDAPTCWNGLSVADYKKSCLHRNLKYSPPFSVGVRTVLIPLHGEHRSCEMFSRPASCARMENLECRCETKNDRFEMCMQEEHVANAFSSGRRHNSNFEREREGTVLRRNRSRHATREFVKSLSENIARASKPKMITNRDPRSMKDARKLTGRQKE